MDEKLVEMTEPFTRFLGSVLPDREGELTPILSSNRVVFFVDETSERIRFTAQSTVDGPQPVTVGRKCLLRLWAHCFSSFLGLKLFVDKRSGHGGAAKLHPSQFQVKAAGEALTWAMRGDVNLKYAQRHGLDYSFPSPPDSLFRTVGLRGDFISSSAEQLFRYALAYLLLHEIEHIRHGHTRTNDGLVSVHQEKDADRGAAAWLLEATNLPETEFLLRRLGVAVALAWLVVPRVFIGHTSTTYPPGWDRLFQTLNQHLEAVDPVWGFLVILLLTHLHTAGKVPEGLSDLAPDADSVNLLLDHISRLHR